MKFFLKQTIKTQFPLFKNHKKLVYLDSAASTQTPSVVLEAMNEFYTKYRANIHRGVYDLSAQATEKYEAARAQVATFINASSEEIVFTSGTTHGLNLLAESIGRTLKPGDNVVMSRMEHHANLIPWQQAAKRYGFQLRFIEIENYELGMKDEELARVIDKHTKVVSIVHVSNSLGTINPIEEIISEAKKVGALTIIDAAQSVAHMPIDVQKLGCDALVFSGHKMYGPTGVGVLYARKALLEHMKPYFFGGDMIRQVTYTDATWHDVPWKFEAGTPNIAGVIGLGAAIEFIESIGFDYIQKHEKEITDYALQKLQAIEGLTIVGPQNNRVGVISFTIEGVHPHDVATILNEDGVAVRAGHHCTMPLMKLLGIPGTTRASFGVYNTTDDVDRLVHALDKVHKIFGSQYVA
jgi:cysteine desulfurase/selenocysteine lyase